jgi:SAM-dependent methyltransferase
VKERPPQHAQPTNFEFNALRAAQNYRRALLREFSPHLRGRVLEIGAGIGQMTELLQLLPAIHYLLAVEPDAMLCDQLRRNLPGQPLLEGTAAALRTDSLWNAIVSINVLEHIQDDAAELRAYRELLARAKGRLCLFVPARQELYAAIDRDFGHHRRYSRPDLRLKLVQAGFALVHLRYFNWVGYFAWWFNFRLLKKRNFDAAAVRFFDRVIFPCVYALESRIATPPFGQSLIAVAQAA